MNVVEHKLDEPIEIVRLLAKPNKKIRPNGLLFKYKTTAKPGCTKDYRWGMAEINKITMMYIIVIEGEPLPQLLA